MLLGQAEIKFNEAKEIGSADSQETQDLASQAESFLNQAQKLAGKDRQDLLFLKQKVTKLLEETRLTSVTATPTLFFDLNLGEKEAKVGSAVIFENRLVILDVAKSSIFFLDLEKKSFSSLKDEKFNQGRKLAVEGQSLYVLLPDGVLKVEVAQKNVKVVISNAQWGKTIDLKAFSNNLYLLDQDQGKIWQYLKAGDGYSAARSWLASFLALSMAASCF